MMSAVQRTPRAHIAKGNLAARQSHVLDAAEACFIRNGIQRTTMQDIAREALMSPANLYRYFSSREGIVEAWVHRECERSDRLIMGHSSSDGREAIMVLAEKVIAGLTRSEAILRLDMWLEVSRNPELTRLLQQLEELSREWLTTLLAPSNYPIGIVEALSVMMRGILVNKAIFPDYDAEPVLTQIRSMIDLPPMQ